MFYSHNSEPGFRQALIWLLAAVTLLASLATILHRLEPQPQWLDLILPPAMACAFAGLTLAALLRPSWSLSIVRLVVGLGVLALVIPAWHYTIVSYRDPAITLVAIFPPITSLLLLLIMLVIVLFPPRSAFAVVLLAWGLISLPILVYLWLHPEELWSPRGKEMLLTFGPALLLLLVIAPFYQRANQQLERLKYDHVKMQRLAEHDALTELYNRHAGMRLLKQFLSRPEAGMVVLFDIDHFKDINDRHGHPVGDRVLQELARRVRKTLRDGNAVIRWGGEEFLVLLDDAAGQALQTIPERIRAVVKAQDFAEVGPVTVSVGVTRVRADDTVDTLLERVDRALYRAKQQGRNCAAVEP